MIVIWYDKQGNRSEISGGGDQHAAVSATHEPPSGLNLQCRPAPVPGRPSPTLAAQCVEGHDDTKRRTRGESVMSDDRCCARVTWRV